MVKKEHVYAYIFKDLLRTLILVELFIIMSVDNVIFPWRSLS